MGKALQLGIDKTEANIMMLEPEANPTKVV